MDKTEAAHLEIAKRYGRRRSGARAYDPDIAASLLEWANRQPQTSIRARAIKAMLFRYVER